MEAEKGLIVFTAECGFSAIRVMAELKGGVCSRRSRKWKVVRVNDDAGLKGPTLYFPLQRM